jgi:hypothetical protein
MSFEDRENGLLEMKKGMSQSLYTWRMGWNNLPVSFFFFGIIFLFFYNIGVL